MSTMDGKNSSFPCIVDVLFQSESIPQKSIFNQFCLWPRSFLVCVVGCGKGCGFRFVWFGVGQGRQGQDQDKKTSWFLGQLGQEDGFLVGSSWFVDLPLFATALGSDQEDFLLLSQQHSGADSQLSQHMKQPQGGKRDEDLILPLNDSISATLSTDHMHAKTTVMVSENFTEDKIWLNGKEESFDNPRLLNCLKDLREKAKRYGDGATASWKVHICSMNNFPTAAGLASSAAGYACLVFTLAKVFGIEGDISGIARRGSGSACRSVFGGFVCWQMGEILSGEDSVATQIVPANHWPNLRVLILVVSDSRKATSSTSGMQRSVRTSELLNHRIKNCVPKRVEAMTKAIQERDFDTFAEITMKDSNQFHAVCLDTYPPAVYLNDVSHSIIRFIHQYNTACGQTKVAYTFDAGPNACLYLLEQDVPTVAALVKLVYPPNPEQQQDFFRGIPVAPSVILPPITEPPQVGKVRYVIHTKVGEGPSQVSDHLLSDSGLPLEL